MFRWSTKVGLSILVLLLMIGLTAYFYDSKSLGLTRHDSTLSNATDLDHVEMRIGLDGRLLQQDGVASKNETYLSVTKRHTTAEKGSEQLYGRVTRSSRLNLKSLGGNENGKRTKRSADPQETLKAKKYWQRGRDIHDVRRYERIKLERVAERSSVNGTAKYDMGAYKRTHSGDSMNNIKLDQVIQRRATATEKRWYNRTGFGRMKRFSSLNRSYVQRKSLESVTHDRYSWIDFDGIRWNVTQMTVFDPNRRRKTKDNWYKWIEEDGMKRNLNMWRTSSHRRTVRAAEYSEYHSPIPDGFPHYYVPCSSIANFIMVYIIQPKHMIFLRQSRGIRECMKNHMINLELTSFRDCQHNVSQEMSHEMLVPRWLMHVTGFIAVSSVIILVSVFTLVLCPCCMCWRTSFGRVIQAGKLDTYRTTTWAVTAVFCCTSILFALFGVITVACAGLGMGHYLRSGQIHHLYSTYERIHAISLDMKNEKEQAKINKTNQVNVRHCVHVLLLYTKFTSLRASSSCNL